jgi:ABC-type Zn uptake system ZnuABC Zn-binding protein ZnuA
MKRSLFLLSALYSQFSTLSLAAEPIQVVATFPVLKDFVEAVGGDHVSVTTLLTGLESEHTYTPKPADLLSVREARLLVKVGLGLEVWLDGLVRNASNPGLRVVNTSAGVGLVKDLSNHTHADGTEKNRLGQAGKQGNPHIWLDPENAKIMIRHITDALIQADPVNRQEYMRGQADYFIQLDRLQRDLIRQVKQLPDRKIVTHHAAWPYFARRFGFEIRGVLLKQVGSEPSSKDLADIIRRMRRERIRVIVSEPQLNPDLPEMVARETSARVAVLTPLPGAIPAAPDYLGMLHYNVNQLIRALTVGP